jgi:hypothetical protein
VNVTSVLPAYHQSSRLKRNRAAIAVVVMPRPHISMKASALDAEKKSRPEIAVNVTSVLPACHQSSRLNRNRAAIAVVVMPRPHISVKASALGAEKKSRPEIAVEGCANFFRAKSPEAHGPRQGLQHAHTNARESVLWRMQHFSIPWLRQNEAL